jgi:signal transduction histidine kinase
MRFGAAVGKLGRAMKSGASPPGGTVLVRRPWVFALLFWGTMAASYFTHLVNVRLVELYGGPEGGPEKLGALPATLGAATVVACWLVLPWDARAGRRRKLAAPAFVVCVSAFGYATGMAWAQALYLVAFANGIFLFGFRRGLAYSAAVLPVASFAILLSWQPDATPLRVLYQTLILAVLGAFVAGVCDAVVDAVRGREEKGRLLGELEAAHAELREYAGRVRELSVAEERARIAREIHDSVGHHLTVANLQLQNAERFRDARPEEAWAEVGDARETTLGALAEVRRSVRALGPLDLRTKTAAGAISVLVRAFKGAGMETTFGTWGRERELPGEAELVLYRAAQEGLTNAAKHSDARRITVTLFFEREGVGFSVVDDGSGAEEGAPERGFGLTSLKERVEALGGGFRAGTRPEGGFALEVRLPLVGGS